MNRPSAGKQTVPSAGKQTVPSAGKQTVPSAGKQIVPSAGTRSNDQDDKKVECDFCPQKMKGGKG